MKTFIIQFTERELTLIEVITRTFAAQLFHASTNADKSPMYQLCDTVIMKCLNEIGDADALQKYKVSDLRQQIKATFKEVNPDNNTANAPKG